LGTARPSPALSFRLTVQLVPTGPAPAQRRLERMRGLISGVGCAGDRAWDRVPCRCEA
jgi:hypothetical protein